MATVKNCKTCKVDKHVQEFKKLMKTGIEKELKNCNVCRSKVKIENKCISCKKIKKTVNKKNRTCADCKLYNSTLGFVELYDGSMEKSLDNKKILWKCINGHTWESDIKTARRYWCRKCRFSEQELKLTAFIKGVKYTYDQKDELITWTCINSHDNKQDISEFKNLYCKQCGMEDRSLLSYARNQLITGGFKIDNPKSGLFEPIIYVCKDGHKSEADYHYIKYWCAECKTDKLTESELDTYIAERNGVGKYDNKIKCKNGHVFEMKDNKWCSECTLLPFEYSKLALLFNGTVANANCSNIKWKCSEGHIFTRNIELVKIGFWCRICFPLKTIQFRKLLMKFTTISSFINGVNKDNRFMYKFNYKGIETTTTDIVDEIKVRVLNVPMHVIYNSPDNITQFIKREMHELSSIKL
jgi:hypothetical protein